jgi:Tfp pilus assembly protein PilF
METWITLTAIFIILFVVIIVSNNRKNAKWRKAKELDRAAAYYNRASENYYEKEGAKNFEDAIDDLTMAIAIDPRYAEAYLSRGALYDDYGKKKEALADYRKFIELSDYKTDSEAFNAYQKHNHLTDNQISGALADPMEVVRVSNESSRKFIKERIRELELYSEKENGQ